MRRALGRRPHQAALLQDPLGPGVAQLEAVLGLQGFVEVLHREVEVAGAVLLDHPFDPVRRHAPPRRSPAPAVDQSLGALRFVAVAQPAKMTLADPQKLRRLNAAHPSGPMLLEPLQIARHAHLRSHSDPPAWSLQTGQIVCYKNRTCRVLPTAASHQVAVLCGTLYRISQCPDATRNDRDLVNGSLPGIDIATSACPSS